MTEATGDSRRRIQQAIEGADEPLTVEDVVGLTGLHANTVRGHLDVLLAGHHISRVPAHAQGRGRPRWLYRASAPKTSAFQYLAEALTAQLTHSSDPEMAEVAAARWAEALPDLPVADTPDMAVDEATEALSRLGFIASRNPVGDAISVSSCPYAELVADNPVICDIHASLVSRLLKQTGQPVTIESMDVWVRPGMCVARLRRPDVSPVRTITIDDRAIMNATEGTAP